MITGDYRGFAPRTCIDCGRLFHPAIAQARRCFPCYKRVRQPDLRDTRIRQLESAVAALEAENDRLRMSPAMHRRLLQLCHPDKHNGSQAATEATRWLLGMRG